MMTTVCVMPVDFNFNFIFIDQYIVSIKAKERYECKIE